MELRPNILLTQNKPLPLTGITPRRLMGNKAWNAVRTAAYAANCELCWACGVLMTSDRGLFQHQCHEVYDIDWEYGEVRIKEFTALCWVCHNFVHVEQITGESPQRILKPETIRIVVRHGWRVLREAGLPLKREWRDWREVAWQEWYLLYNSKKYFSDFYSYEDWLSKTK